MSGAWLSCNKLQLDLGRVRSHNNHLLTRHHNITCNMKTKENFHKDVREHFQGKVVAFLHPDAEVEKSDDDIKWLRRQEIAIITPPLESLPLLATLYGNADTPWKQDSVLIITGGTLWDNQWESPIKKFFRRIGL